MKVPKPIFDVPSKQGNAKAKKKKRKKSRAEAVDSVALNPYRDCVDSDRPARIASEEDGDCLREFVRQASMPGAIIFDSDIGTEVLCEQLGTEVRYAGGDGDEEEAGLE